MARNLRALPAKTQTLLHPVRMRIVKTLESGNKTPGEIAALLPDVPQATLYRHIAHLDQAGVIAVVERHQVHGTVERVFSLVREASVLGYSDLADAASEDKVALARIFFGEVASAFERYFRSGQDDLMRDSVVMYEQVAHLTADEAAQVRQEMRNLIERYVSNPPGSGRRPYSLTAASVPEAELPAPAGGRRPAEKAGADD